MLCGWWCRYCITWLCPSPSFHSQLVAMEVGMEVVMVAATEEEEEEEDMKEGEGL